MSSWSSDDDEYLWSFKIKNKKAREDIKKLIEQVSRATTKISGNNPTAKGILSELQSKILPDLKKMLDSISTKRGSVIQSILSDLESEMKSSFENRASEQFDSHSRYSAAINDPKFTRIRADSDGIKLNVGSMEVLDEHTTIWINMFGASVPSYPATYNYESWWRWQEFEGTNSKVNFRNMFAWYYVAFPPPAHDPYTNLFGGISPRPVFTADNFGERFYSLVESKLSGVREV